MPEAIATEPTPASQAAPATATSGVTEAPKRGLGIVFWVSMAWIALLFFLAIFANVLPIRDPEELGIITGEVEPFESPGRNAWFGADAQGKDLFANVVHGARPALILGITVTLMSAAIGTTIGIIAGYFRGRTDGIIMASTDIALAFPAIVLLIAVRASLGNSIWVFIGIFTILGIAPYSRIVRGSTLSLAEREFVKAARAMGAGRPRIILREILPNVVLSVVSFAFIGFAIVIAAEGSLAFIGLSLDQTTWGKLINDGRAEIADHAFLSLIPATVMFITILAFNFVGDSFRGATAAREVSTVRRHEIEPLAADTPVRTPDTPLLKITDLCTELATPAGMVHAVDHVSLEVAAGEALAIVGESGCGKTMTIRSILGTFPLSGVNRSGQVDLDGTDLLRTDDDTRLRTLGTDIGTIPQNPLTALNPVRRIEHQITEPMILHGGLTKAEARKRALDLLEQVGIPSPAIRLRVYPHELSGGMRQRIMIAVALANSPRLVLADEPTTALDVTVQDQIMRLLTSLRTDYGMAMVLVTHDLAVVEGFTDRVAVMYAGQIVESGPTADVLADPRHQYTHALIKSIPNLGLDPHSRLATIPGNPPSLLAPPIGCRFAARCTEADDRCIAEQPPITQLDGGRTFSCWKPVSETPVEVADGR